METLLGLIIYLGILFAIAVVVVVLTPLWLTLMLIWLAVLLLYGLAMLIQKAYSQWPVATVVTIASFATLLTIGIIADIARWYRGRRKQDV